MRIIVLFAVLLTLDSGSARAETPEERTARATAELTAIKAETALEAARYTALKDVFGQVPTVGVEGTISITDATTGQLLRNKAGSLLVAKSIAIQLCAELKEAKVDDVFIAPTDLDVKMQGSQLVVSELDFLHGEVSKSPALAGATSALAGLSVAKYGIDGVVSILKLFRSNYEVGLSTTDRSAWLAYFVSATCPKILPVVNTDFVTRTKSVSDAIDKLNTIVKYADDYDRLSTAATEKIALEEKVLATERAKEKKEQDARKIKVSEDEVESQRKSLKDQSANKGLVTRIKALNQFVSSKPAEFLDAVMWNQYRLAPYDKKPRLILSLATQDSQLVKSNYFLGKRIFGQSAGEVMYRVMDVDGKTKAAGFITASETLGKVNFDASDAMRCVRMTENSNVSACATP